MPGRLERLPRQVARSHQLSGRFLLKHQVVPIVMVILRCRCHVRWIAFLLGMELRGAFDTELVPGLA